MFVYAPLVKQSEKTESGAVFLKHTHSYVVDYLEAIRKD